MYINTKKVASIIAYILGASAGALGLVMVGLSRTAEEQSAGALMAIFGLLLTWFVAWLGRGK